MKKLTYLLILLYNTTVIVSSSCKLEYETQHEYRRACNYHDYWVKLYFKCTYDMVYNPKQYNIHKPSYNVEGCSQSINQEKSIEVTFTNSHISTLPPDAFKIDDDISLTALKISEAQLEIIEPNAFLLYSNLRILDLSHNKIAKLENYTFMAHNLENINLTYNNISFIESNAFNSSKLVKLDLSHNFVENIDFMLLQQSLLNNINFCYNNLTILKNNTLYLNSSDVTLNFAHNQITTIHENVFSNIQELTEIDLSHNKIRNIENIFASNATTFINLKENYITNITKFTFQTPNLIKLLLSHNDIVNLSSGSFSNLNLLQILDLSSNKIVNITTGLLVGLNSLTNLNVSNNKISFIFMHAFYNTPNLKHLDISKNRISNINSEELLIPLESINFAENKFKCSKLAGLIKTLNDSKITVARGLETSEISIHGIACNDFETADNLQNLNQLKQEMHSLVHVDVLKKVLQDDFNFEKFLNQIKQEPVDVDVLKKVLQDFSKKFVQDFKEDNEFTMENFEEQITTSNVALIALLVIIILFLFVIASGMYLIFIKLRLKSVSTTSDSCSCKELQAML